MYSSRLIKKLSQATERGPLVQKFSVPPQFLIPFFQHVQKMETIIGKPVRIVVTTHTNEWSLCFQIYRRSAEAVRAVSLKSIVAFNNAGYFKVIVIIVSLPWSLHQAIDL